MSMAEPEMSAMFPNGIRALIVDDDTKFVKSATVLLSALNFEVVRCSTVIHALNKLTSGDLGGIDVILVHAAKAAACGFDFRAIVEADLRIPVIYFLPLDHQAAGDEADQLLRTLQEGTYLIKKPLDANEVRTRLWMAVAWGKCLLNTKAKNKGTSGGGKRTIAAAKGEDDDNRVHYKVVRGRKRKGGPGGTTVAAGGGQPSNGQEKDNVADQQQREHDRGKKAMNSSGEAFKQIQQPNKAMVNVQQPGRQQPRKSLFLESVLRTVDIPPYNPKFFSDTTGPSSNAPHSWSFVYHQQQDAPPQLTFGPFPYQGPRPQFSTGIGNQQQQQDNRLQLQFGPFPYQGTPPPVVQQDMVAPAAAVGLFAGGMAGGGTTAGASATAAVTTGASVIDEAILQPPYLGGEQDGDDDLIANIVGMDTTWVDPPMAPQHVGAASDKAAILAALLSDDFDDYIAGSPLFGMAWNVNDLTTMAGGAFGTSDAASFMAPHQDFVAAPNGDQQLALDNKIYGSLMGPQGRQSPGAAVMDEDDDGLMEFEAMIDSDQFDDKNLGAVMDGVDDSLIAANLAFDQYEDDNPSAAMDGVDDGLNAPMLDYDQFEDDNIEFPLDALLEGLPLSPMFNADQDAQLGGSAGGAAAGDDAAGTSLTGGEGGGGDMDNWSIANALDGIDIPNFLP